jgi:shikimate kinase
MFYSAALGTPASLGLIPPIPGLGAFAAEQTGNGPVYVWNPNSATWSYLANTVLFNPLMFYDTTVGTPMSLSLVPPTQSIGALCAEKSGNGPMYVWNPSTHTWN